MSSELSISVETIHAGQTRAYGPTVDERVLTITNSWNGKDHPVSDGWAENLARRLYGTRTWTYDGEYHAEPIPLKNDRNHGLDSYLDLCEVESPGVVRIRVVTPYND